MVVARDKKFPKQRNMLDNVEGKAVRTVSAAKDLQQTKRKPERVD